MLLLRLVISTILLFGFDSIGQSTMKANNYFDNFDYEKALDEFEAIQTESALNATDARRLSYCYFVTKNGDGATFIDSIISEGDEYIELIYWRGKLEMIQGRFDAALTSFEYYKKNGGSHKVDDEITSCQLIPSWENDDSFSVQNDSVNDSYSNNYSRVSEETIYFLECSITGSGSFEFASKIENSEGLLFMKPFRKKESGLVAMELYDSLIPLSINSIIVDTIQDALFFCGAIANSASDFKYTSRMYSITQNQEIILADLSKQLNASVSHLTLSGDGKMLAFSVMSEVTQGSDIYYSIRENNQWTEPLPLDAVNTKSDELFPNFQGDTLITFSSNGRDGYGDLDIYSIALDSLFKNGHISHFKSPINSTSDDFNFSWVSSEKAMIVSNRPGGQGDDDVWICTKILNESISQVEVAPIVETPVEPENDGFEEWFDNWNNAKVHFDFAAHKAKLPNDFLLGLEKYHDKYSFSIEFVGHTDNVGDQKKNHFLGLKRANYLKNQIQVESSSLSRGSLDAKIDADLSHDELRSDRFVLIKLKLEINKEKQE